MGRKAKVQALLAALIAWPVSAQDTGNVLVNGGFQQGLTGWYETGPGGVYDGCGPAGGYCYVFSYATGVVQQTFVAKTNYTGYIVGFDYRLPCNNSIGGYCSNPNGPRDWLTANLSLYLGETQVQSVPLLSVQTYQPEYATFSLTGTAPSAFNTATLTFTGQDVGFWAGPYGPQLDRVSLTLTGSVEAQPAISPVSVVPTPAPAPAPNPIEIPAQEEQIAAAEAAVDEVVAIAPPEAVEAVAEPEAVSEAVSEEVTQEEPAEDANDPPPPPGLLPGAPPSESAIVVSVTRKDRNVAFFQSEAAEEADLFPRETVLQASLQNVAFVAQADAQYAAQYGEQTTTETVAETYSIQPTEGPTFAPVITTVIGADTPSGQAQQLELLGMQGEFASGEPKDIGDVNTQDGETMAQLGAVPVGYSAYTQARIPDLPFYQPRDIYKGRRIPDANLALYRMMQGQDQRWNEMVEDQYE